MGRLSEEEHERLSYKERDPRAKTLEGWIASIEIFAKNHPEGLKNSYCFEGQHDIIFTHFTEEEIPEDSEDGKALVRLGWFVDSDTDGWATFT